MTVCFTNMPSWAIVAVAARIARHVQGAVACSGLSNRAAVNDAIQIAEDTSRHRRMDSRASEFGARAKDAADDAARVGFPMASYAASCAAEAATCLHLQTDREGLLAAAERTLDLARKAIRPECLADFEADIEQISQLGCSLADSDPVHPDLLAFVHYQAVHEAGHAVAACLLGILFSEAQIIYNAGVNPVRTPCDASYSSETPSDFCAEDRFNYRLFYAAGAAAEDLVFGKRREWGCVGDRRCHSHPECGGTDFDGDAAKVRNTCGFSKSVLLKIASLLEARGSLSCDDIERAMTDLQND